MKVLSSGRLVKTDTSLNKLQMATTPKKPTAEPTFNPGDLVFVLYHDRGDESLVEFNYWLGSPFESDCKIINVVHHPAAGWLCQFIVGATGQTFTMTPDVLIPIADRWKHSTKLGYVMAIESTELFNAGAVFVETPAGYFACDRLGVYLSREKVKECKHLFEFHLKPKS